MIFRLQQEMTSHICVFTATALRETGQHTRSEDNVCNYWYNSADIKKYLFTPWPNVSVSLLLELLGKLLNFWCDIVQKHPQLGLHLPFCLIIKFRCLLQSSDFYNDMSVYVHSYAVRLYIENVDTEIDNTILYRYIKDIYPLTHHYCRIEPCGMRV